MYWSISFLAMIAVGVLLLFVLSECEASEYNSRCEASEYNP